MNFHEAIVDAGFDDTDASYIIMKLADAGYCIMPIERHVSTVHRDGEMRVL